MQKEIQSNQNNSDKANVQRAGLFRKKKDWLTAWYRRDPGLAKSAIASSATFTLFAPLISHYAEKLGADKADAASYWAQAGAWLVSLVTFVVSMRFFNKEKYAGHPWELAKDCSKQICYGLFSQIITSSFFSLPAARQAARFFSATASAAIGVTVDKIAFFSIFFSLNGERFQEWQKAQLQKMKSLFRKNEKNPTTDSQKPDSL